MNRLKVVSLTCEYRTNPLGLDIAQPRFSWQLLSEERGTLQKGYQLVVAGADSNFEAPLWDTGFVDTDQSIQITYAGPALQSRTRYSYRVKVQDQSGAQSDWSDTATFETAFLTAGEWQADWIAPRTAGLDVQSEAAFLLRKGFETRDDIASARIYATAAGVYELYLNGQQVSEDLLAPGWTSYNHRHQYQTYDVTALLQSGSNALGILLGQGWYHGMGFENRNYAYGERRAALLQLHVEYKDGAESVILTDDSWQSSPSAIVYSTVYHGETYDARLEQTGWDQAGFVADKPWNGVDVCEEKTKTQLVAQENNPTRVTETIRPIAYFVTPAGDHVLDMGQNMVGRIRMTVDAPAGTRIVVRHAEVLDKDGNIYFGNLRPAKQTMEYIAKGEGTECYAPHFTFMGFRYIRVEGYPGDRLPIEAFVGEVVHTDMEPTGQFECSDERVNKLQSNIKWGQRGNFVDVPTDCPQRDERLGWTGDAQVFISTALYNFQGGPFFTKWVRDLAADQLPHGGVPFVIPDVVGGSSSAAWGDAAVICPWTVYQYYGDKRLLAEQYGSMQAWVEYIRGQGDDEFLWNTGFHFGDWLGLDAKEDSYIGATPTALIGTAYYAYSTRLLRDTARILGKTEDAAKYDELQRNVVKAFREEFITATGRIAAPTQTAHVLALIFDLVDDRVRTRVAADLNDLIVENNYHLTTGFVGTPYLCFALSNNGYHDTAVRILLQESYPGWLYSVSQGATTIWEHWDSLKPDGSFWSDDMNSFNHYSYGAIGDWMYRKVAGLDMDSSTPAFKKIHIEPLFGTRKLTYARTSHLSMYGRIEAGWKIEGDRFEVSLTIPANTTAEVVLRGATLDQLAKHGGDSADAAGIAAAKDTERGAVLTVGSGTYCFIYLNADMFRTSYTEDTKVKELMSDEAAAAVVRRLAPQLFDGPVLTFMGSSPLKQLTTENSMARITREEIDAILEELAK
ncbi:family 78 glycoside hydrolase catalytic domain [Cohnella boryungensis]|uniref:alpha-L-rhamnosidase n=1 Tax=Cohnella boryungensis TaxID=768479 RepID=A0ABV8S739_9BACL